MGVIAARFAVLSCWLFVLGEKAGNQAKLPVRFR